MARYTFPARLLLGFLFAASGISKLLLPVEEFAAVVQIYELLPPALIFPFAKILPWLELLLGVYLFLGYATRLSSAGLGILSASFIIALGINLLRGTPLGECGCFGKALSLSPLQALGLDMLLLGLAILIYKNPPRTLSLDHLLKRNQSR
ncbi:MAG: DoxX family membrane protein [Elusimicrobia bacterium]|nr:DoxX family membrane protein [Elusimicrobiota bacterium]